MYMGDGDTGDGDTGEGDTVAEGSTKLEPSDGGDANGVTSSP